MTYDKGHWPPPIHPTSAIGGCRAPELAAGVAVNNLRVFAANTMPVLKTFLHEASTDALKTMLVSQWEMMLAGIVSGMSAKLHHWSELPYILVGLGHADSHIVAWQLKVVCLRVVVVVQLTVLFHVFQAFIPYIRFSMSGCRVRAKSAGALGRPFAAVQAWVAALPVAEIFISGLAWFAWRGTPPPPNRVLPTQRVEGCGLVAVHGTVWPATLKLKQVDSALVRVPPLSQLFAKLCRQRPFAVRANHCELEG